MQEGMQAAGPGEESQADAWRLNMAITADSSEQRVLPRTLAGATVLQIVTALRETPQVRTTISAARARTGDSLRLTPMQVLEMATLNGARALGRLGDLGSLEAGKCADVLVVDLQKPHFYPLIDPIGSLIHNMVGWDIDTVLVDGRVVVDGGRLTTVPHGEILANAQRAADGVWARLRAMYPGV